MNYRIALLTVVALSFTEPRSEATVVVSTTSLISGTASESSDPYGFPASRAIDGVKTGANPDFNHTNNGADEWWNVILPSNITANGIRIYNRTDCCGERLLGSTVKAFDDASLINTVYTSAPIASTAGRQDFVFVGTQSVRSIEVRQHNNFLSLGEVELLNISNVVLPLDSDLTAAGMIGMEATQSSTWGGGVYPAGNAIDGSTTNFTHTADGQSSNQWWKVNLGEEVQIQRVQLFNRGDGCCPSRMRDLTVEVLSAAGAIVWTSALINPADALGSPANIMVDIAAANGGNPVVGSQVRVTRTTDPSDPSHNGYILALGEVKVFGGSRADSDSDGMPDVYEIAQGLDPNLDDSLLDPDNDNLNNLGEYLRHTDPHVADTDVDGLLDGAETGTGIYVSNTNTGTNALVADTDGDGLLDGVETATGIWVGASNRGTNPFKKDSDGDGLADAVETNTGTFVSAADPGTDPNKYDTDGDTYPDGGELLYAKNPLDIASKPFPTGSSFLLAYWPFNDSSTPTAANDVVMGFTGTTTGTYSVDGGGQSGQPGDRAMQFTPDQVVATTSAFANLASPADSITVSFWQKLNVRRNSSAFWMYAASAGGGQRGMQIHTPWSDNNIYFDHSGCCNGPQRLAGPLPNIDTAEWHHFLLVKSGGTKQVYVDGLLVLNGTGADPLATDFTTMTIGGGDNFMDGSIDDFAVFAGSLSHTQICRLSAGESPATILTPIAGNEFKITDIQLTAGDQVQITWNSVPGCNYTIQTSTSLDGWVPAATGLAAPSTSTTVEIPRPPGARVFFRVAEE